MKWEFRNDGAVAVGDLFSEGEIFGRIELHQTGTEDAYGAAFGGDGSFVGGGVDAAGETGDDGESGSGELVGELCGWSRVRSG